MPNRNTTKTTVVASLAAIALLPALAACGTPAAHTEQVGPSDTATSAPAKSEAPTTAASETPAATKAAGPASEQPSTASITDDVLDHRIRATEVVRNFPIDPAKQSGFVDRAGVDQVLVKLDVTAGSNYYGQVSCLDVRVVPSGTTDPTQSQASEAVIGSEMAAAGYAPLEPAKTGTSSSGWCGFLVTGGADKPLDLLYTRLSYKGSDGSDIPEKTFRATLLS